MSVETKIYLNDSGTEIVLDGIKDIHLATIMLIKYLKPSGISGSWQANPVIGEVTKAKYVTGVGILNESGTWKVQLYVEFPTWKGHGEVASFVVYDPIM